MDFLGMVRGLHASIHAKTLNSGRIMVIFCEKAYTMRFHPRERPELYVGPQSQRAYLRSSQREHPLEI